MPTYPGVKLCSRRNDDPDGVIDKIATGTIEADRPGVLPLPCAVGSPSGAFLDMP